MRGSYRSDTTENKAAEHRERAFTFCGVGNSELPRRQQRLRPLRSAQKGAPRRLTPRGPATMAPHAAAALVSLQ